jgi:hypothetical protein
LVGRTPGKVTIFLNLQLSQKIKLILVAQLEKKVRGEWDKHTFSTKGTNDDKKLSLDFT